MESTDLLHSNDQFRFLGLVHDLRNPIHKIVFASSLLTEELDQADRSEIAEYASLITRACSEVMCLVDRMMTTEKQRCQPVLERVNVTEVLVDCASIYAKIARDKGQTFTLNLPSETIIAHLDRFLIGRVVDNLVQNAIKFTRSGGTVTLSLSCTVSTIRIAVTDTGVGISSKLLRRLFEPFTPASRLGTNGEVSSGLGLFTAKRILEAHRGTLCVQSKTNKGSVFAITLPLFSMSLQEC